MEYLGYFVAVEKESGRLAHKSNGAHTRRKGWARWHRTQARLNLTTSTKYLRRSWIQESQRHWLRKKSGVVMMKDGGFLGFDAYDF